MGFATSLDSHHESSIPTWSPAFQGNILLTKGRVIGELQIRESEFSSMSIGMFSKLFIGVRNITVVNVRNLANRGAPVHNRDLVCQFTGCSASFIIREVYGSQLINREHFTSWSRAIDVEERLDCVFIGPCDIEALEPERKRRFTMLTSAIR